MSLAIYLPAVLAAILGADHVLDSMQYADSAPAREAWVAAEGTPAVEVKAGGDGRAVVLLAPFAENRKLTRAVVDQRVQLDLSEPGAFALEVAIDEPKA
ncbi:MAG: hypothetical protein U1E05_05640, partial [Patescibacteria group bacterium]|nr:hypothetical protein [Patescibacteria group bacterium]